MERYLTKKLKLAAFFLGFAASVVTLLVFFGIDYEVLISFTSLAYFSVFVLVASLLALHVIRMDAKYEAIVKTLSKQNHGIVHKMRDCIYKMNVVFDKTCRRIETCTDQGGIDMACVDFNESLKNEVRRYGRLIADNLKRYVDDSFSRQSIDEECSVMLLMILDPVEHLGEDLKELSMEELSNIFVSPYAFDDGLFKERIYVWERKVGKRFPPFSVGECSALASSFRKRSRYYSNGPKVDKGNDERIPPKILELETDMKINSKVVAPVHYINPDLNISIVYGFVVVMAENERGKKLFYEDKESDIYHNIGLCADALVPVFLKMGKVEEKLKAVVKDREFMVSIKKYVDERNSEDISNTPSIMEKEES